VGKDNEGLRAIKRVKICDEFNFKKSGRDRLPTQPYFRAALKEFQGKKARGEKTYFSKG